MMQISPRLSESVPLYKRCTDNFWWEGFRWFYLFGERKEAELDARYEDRAVHANGTLGIDESD